MEQANAQINTSFVMYSRGLGGGGHLYLKTYKVAPC